MAMSPDLRKRQGEEGERGKGGEEGGGER